MMNDLDEQARIHAYHWLLDSQNVRRFVNAVKNLPNEKRGKEEEYASVEFLDDFSGAVYDPEHESLFLFDNLDEFCTQLEEYIDNG